jgi:NitT/TauT family transport system substrate-binding protein
MKITLYEPLRGVFYTPFYCAVALDAFGQEGVSVTLKRPTFPEEAALDVLSGVVDITWGGPMRLMNHHDRDPDCGLVGFCEVVTRDPFYLVGREPNRSFRFADLITMRLGSVSEVPTPWLCLQDDLRRAGIDPGTLDRVEDQSMADNLAALESGALNVVQVFEPYVEQAVRGGIGHIWYAASSRGPTSYTCFYGKSSTLQARPELPLAMTRAMLRTLKWFHVQSSETIAGTIQGYFPDLEPVVLASAIKRYRCHGLWGSDPVLPPVGFVRLKCSLLSGGFITRDVPFDACVDNHFADIAMASAFPPLEA